MSISPYLKAMPIAVTQRAALTGLFYLVAKSQVKNPEALKWICLACIGQEVLEVASRLLLEKKPLHFEKIVQYFEDKKWPHMIKGIEMIALLILVVSPVIITGIVQKDLKTAFIAFVVLDFFAPKAMLLMRETIFSKGSKWSQPIYPPLSLEWRKEMANELFQFGLGFNKEFQGNDRFKQITLAGIKIFAEDLPKLDETWEVDWKTKTFQKKIVNSARRTSVFFSH